MSTESPLQQAVRLNNEAAALVSTNQLVDAARLLRTATELLRTAASMPEHAEPTTQATGLMEPASMDGCVRRSHGEHYNYNQEDSMYIFDHLFLLPDDMVCVTTTTEQGCDEMFRTLSVYILFNLALVHHMGGREMGDESLLAKAKAIYGHLWRAAKDDTKEDLLQCLVVNALADIHHWLCEYDTCALCMEVVADIASESLCLTKNSLLTDDEVESILLNQLFIQYPCAAKAA